MYYTVLAISNKNNEKASTNVSLFPIGIFIAVPFLEILYNSLILRSILSQEAQEIGYGRGNIGIEKILVELVVQARIN